MEATNSENNIENDNVQLSPGSDDDVSSIGTNDPGLFLIFCLKLK